MTTGMRTGLAGVAGAFIAATIVGGVVAAAIARRHAMRLATIVSGLILLASAINFVAIPHPAWVIVATLVGVPLAAWLTGRLGQSTVPA